MLGINILVLDLLNGLFAGTMQEDFRCHCLRSKCLTLSGSYRIGIKMKPTTTNMNPGTCGISF